MEASTASKRLRADFAASIERAAAPLRAASFEGEIALVLGSGQGELVESATVLRECPVGEIPGFAPPTVAGHAGRLLQIEHSGRRPLVLQGRLHRYEGHAHAELLLGIGVLHALGCRTLLLANAAGGLRPDLRSGDLMLLSDMIDLHLEDPLRGLVEPDEHRGHVMPFDVEHSLGLIDAARRTQIPLRRGVYASVFGPNYETQAEIRMLRILGADAVGMSTAAEAAFARALGMRVLGLSCITNVARETGAQTVSHEEVVAVSNERNADFARLVFAWLEEL